MKKIILTTVLLLSLGLTASCGWTKPKEQESGSIKLGIIFPLTGTSANLGNSAKNAILMALDDLPKEQRKKIAVVFEDGGHDGPMTVTAYQKMKEIDKIDVLAIFGAPGTMAVAPLVVADKIPLLAMAPTIDNPKDFYNVWFTAKAQAQPLYQETSKRGYKKVALLSSQVDSVLKIRDTLRDFIKNDPSMSLVYDQSVMPNEMSFQTEVAKIKQTEPDIIIANFMPAQYIPFGTRAKEQGLDKPTCLTTGTVEGAGDPKVLEGLFPDNFYTVQYATPEFTKAFQERYNIPPLAGAACMYDIVQIVAKATASGKSIDQFVQEIKNYSGAMGVFSYSPERHSLETKALLKTIKGGKFTTYEEEEPAD